MQSLLGQRQYVMAVCPNADTPTCKLGKGPCRGNAGLGFAPEEPHAETPEREVYSGRSTRVTEHRRCFRRNRSQVGSGNFLFDPSMLNIREELQNRVSLSKVYSVIISQSLS